MAKTQGSTDHFPMIPVAWAYFITAALLLTLGAWAQDRDFYSGMIFTEYGLVLGTVLLMIRWLRVRPQKTMRLNPLPPKSGALVCLTVIFAMPITLFLNLLTIAITSWFGKAYDLPIPSADTMSQLTVLFFIISISAGICEEAYFRGMMMGALESRFGTKVGILASAVLFGMFHFNPQNLLGPIFLGLLFGYLVYRTDSLLAGLVGHMTNNGVSVLIGYFAGAASSAKEAQQGMDLFNSNPQMALMALGVYGLLSIGCGVVVFNLIRAIQRLHPAPVFKGKPDQESGWVMEHSEALSDTNTSEVTKKKDLLWIGLPFSVVGVAYLFVSILVFSKA